MKYSDFRPKGKTDLEILESMLSKSKALIFEREKISARHEQELDRYRELQSSARPAIDFEASTLRRMLEIAEPEEFDYDFHAYRKSVLEGLESRDRRKLADLFPEFCQRTSIKPLLLTILDEDTAMKLVYGLPENERELPKLDLDAFDWQEMGFTILKLYVSFSERYGSQELLNLLKCG